MSENLKIKLSSSAIIEASTNSGGTANYTVAISGYTSGAYYSWYNATAGTGTSSQTSGDATNSICPKGWRLPSNYSNVANISFGGLFVAYDISPDTHTVANEYKIFEAAPISLSQTGRRGGNGYDWGWAGYYWSSTAYNASIAYYLWWDSRTGQVVPQRPADGKDHGMAVRCIAIR